VFVPVHEVQLVPVPQELSVLLQWHWLAEQCFPVPQAWAAPHPPQLLSFDVVSRQPLAPQSVPEEQMHA
jgi:hypothetical protein